MVGSVTVDLPTVFSVTGVSAASEVGSVQTNFAFTVEGVSAKGLVSNPNIWTIIDTSQTSRFLEIDADQTPDWTEIAA